jgi:dihydroorotate dehydrogenase
MKNRNATEIAGLKLSNPTILAAGILGYTGLSMKSVIEAGAGAVVSKCNGLTKPRNQPLQRRNETTKTARSTNNL